MFRWEEGRQSKNSTNKYFKMKIFISNLFKCDCYLIKYPKGSYILEHKDPSPLEGYGHKRINIILKDCIKGGYFILDGQKQKKSILYKFRPDTQLHAVSEIEEGELLNLFTSFLYYILSNFFNIFFYFIFIQ